MHHHTRTTIVRDLMFRGLPLATLLVFAGCGHQIGDACSTNVDCSPLGDRFCDTAPPGGYCTIENCDTTTCPSEAVCIRFFIPVMNEQCAYNPNADQRGWCHDPHTGLPMLANCQCEHTDDICVCDKSDKNGNCLPGTGSSALLNGHCAPASTEHRWCQKTCNSDGDCRTGYQCRRTGTQGAEPVPTLEMSSPPQVSFCAPTMAGTPPPNTTL